jgi:uncharacterized membrane protein (UPF0127 family)
MASPGVMIMKLNRSIIILSLIVVIPVAAAVFYQVSAGHEKHHPLSTTEVVINQKKFHAEVAKTQGDIEQGLSGRDSLPEGNGMLFVFDKPGYYPFWMREMKFPLDMIFLYQNKIVAVYPNVPPMKPNENGPQYGGDTKIDRVLEINAGLAQKYSFEKGDSIKVDL